MRPVAERYHPRRWAGGVLVSFATAVWWPAALARQPQPVFGCSLGAKTVSVVRDGNDWVYRFGKPGKADLTIVGNVAKNNVFFRAERYFSMEYQIRFIKGKFSYIVFSLPSNSGVGAHGISGLIVLKDMKVISSMSCDPWEHLDFPDQPDLPEDGDDYLAMRL